MIQPLEGFNPTLLYYLFNLLQSSLEGEFWESPMAALIPKSYGQNVTSPARKSSVSSQPKILNNGRFRSFSKRIGW